MNNDHPQDLDELRVALPAFIARQEADTTAVAERPAAPLTAKTAADAAADRDAALLAELAKFIKVPSGIPPIGADAALKVSKCFAIVAADVRAIAADRVRAAAELQQEAETYATVLEKAGKVLATRVSAEATRAYKLSTILMEARDIINGPTQEESTQEEPTQQDTVAPATAP